MPIPNNTRFNENTVYPSMDEFFRQQRPDIYYNKPPSNFVDYALPLGGAVAGNYFGGRSGGVLGGALGGALSNNYANTLGSKIGNGIGGMVGNYFGNPELGYSAGKNIGSVLGGAAGGALQGYMMPSFSDGFSNLKDAAGSYLGLGNQNPQNTGSPLDNNRQRFAEGGAVASPSLWDYVAPVGGAAIGNYLGGTTGGVLGGAAGGALTNNAYSKIGGTVGGGLGSLLGAYFGSPTLSSWGKSIGSTLGGGISGGITGYNYDPNKSIAGQAASAVSPYIKSQVNPSRTAGSGSNNSFSAYNPFNYMNATPQYAHGGKVDQVPHMAEMIRQHGEREDQILAHINPEEAYELGEKYGWDINPETGLPQYGFFSGLGKIFKQILPILGTVVGSVLGGPLGGVLGGTLGGVGAHSGGNRHDMLGGGLGGGLGGAISGYGGSALSSLFGSGASGATQGAPSGLGALFGSGKGLTPGAQMMISRGAPGLVSKGASSGLGGIGSLLGGLGQDAMNNPLNTILGLTTIAGTLGRKEKIPHQQTTEESLAEYEKVKRAMGDKGLSEIEGAGPREYIEEEEEEPVQYGKTRSYIRNNRAFKKKGGYLPGPTGGQDDKIDAQLSHGEYVIHAPAVSALGDGNNEAGANKLDKFMVNVMKQTNGIKYPKKSKSVEYYLRG